MTIPDSLDAILAMRQPWGHVTSSRVTKMFLPIVSHRKKTTAPCMVSLYSAHQDASNDIHFDLEVTLRSRDMRSPLDLDLMRSWYTYFDAYQREDLDGALTFALTQLVQKLLATNSLALRSRHFDFFLPLWRHFLPDLKMTSLKNYRACPSVSNAVYRVSLACFVFKISGGAVISPPPSVLRWLEPPSVRGFKETVHLPSMWLYLR